MWDGEGGRAFERKVKMEDVKLRAKFGDQGFMNCSEGVP
jgi:hypothetical protein